MDAGTNHLKLAKKSLQARDVNTAVGHILAAIIEINAREKRKAAFANRLIAENMFAIVRLEIAQGADHIINVALEVKRNRTGSGKAAFALNVAGTLVMLAGNVLTGGGMSLLGNLLVATGEMLQAASKNDKAGMASGLLHAGTAGASSLTNDGRKDIKEQGFQFKQEQEVEDGKFQTQSESEGIIALISSVCETGLDLAGQTAEFTQKEKESTDTYAVVKKETAWISHGAGGTHAITTDVQEAVKDSYGRGLQKIASELRTISSDGAKVKLGPDSILGQILSKPIDPSATLHPMTSWVLSDAIKKLAETGGPRYRALTGGSGMFGRESVLNEAKRDVKAAYYFMSNSSPAKYLTKLEDVEAEIKRLYG